MGLFWITVGGGGEGGNLHYDGEGLVVGDVAGHIVSTARNGETNAGIHFITSPTPFFKSILES